MEHITLLNLNNLNRAQHEYVLGLVSGPIGKYVLISKIFEDTTRPEKFRLETILAIEHAKATPPIG